MFDELRKVSMCKWAPRQRRVGERALRAKEAKECTRRRENTEQPIHTSHPFVLLVD
jgi:hypothetical protein